jgi:hypothetical protein
MRFIFWFETKVFCEAFIFPSTCFVSKQYKKRIVIKAIDRVGGQAEQDQINISKFVILGSFLTQVFWVGMLLQFSQKLINLFIF